MSRVGLGEIVNDLSILRTGKYVMKHAFGGLPNGESSFEWIVNITHEEINAMIVFLNEKKKHLLFYQSM